MDSRTKFCKYCGEIIDWECVVCPKCGKQVEELKGNRDNPIIINNNNNNNASSSSSASAAASVNVGGSRRYGGKPKSKWVALLLCIFLGVLGAHKFYEGKIGMGILYLCTGAFCSIGWIIDIISLLGKPETYYV